MDKEEIKKIISTSNKLSESTYFMGTKAYHGLGDISSDEEDLFIAHKETDNYYVGNWVTGFGFIDVLFPKETSRRLNDNEVEKYSKTYIQINSNPPYILNGVK